MKIDFAAILLISSLFFFSPFLNPPFFTLQENKMAKSKSTKSVNAALVVNEDADASYKLQAVNVYEEPMVTESNV